MSIIVQVHAIGNSKAGEEKSIVCSACHGPQGISANPAWPNLAGQHAPYLLKQLHDFKAGEKRDAPTMSPMVAQLSEQDMTDLAAFYSQKPAAQGNKQIKTTPRGEILYRQGDRQNKITACITCHDPDGRGNAQAGFPALSGQQSAYTIQQLQAFKSGNRANDLNHIMHDITQHMSDEDMIAIANYLEIKS